VIEVEVREDDVANVPRVEAEPLDLAHCGQALHEPRPQEREEEAAEPRARIGHVAKPEAGIDEDQTALGLEQEAMAAQLAAADDRARPPIHQASADRTGGDAAQVVDAHGPTLTGRAPMRRARRPCAAAPCRARPAC